MDHIEDPELRERVKRGNYPGPDRPLHSIPHPLISGFDRFATLNQARLPMLRASRGRMVKAKSGSWRGAVCIDNPQEDLSSQQQWLVAAGLRREGDTDDFYSVVEAALAGDPAAYDPSPDDREYLAIERRRTEEAERDERRTVRIVEGLVLAIQSPATTVQVDLGDDQRVDLVLHVETEDLTEFMLTVYLPYTDPVEESVLAIQESVPGVPLSDWGFEPANPARGVYTLGLSAMVSDGWVKRLQAAVDQLSPTVVARRQPSLCDHPSTPLAHVVESAWVVAAAVTQRPLRAMCGEAFVPQHDPLAHAACPKCAMICAAITEVRTRL